MTDVAASTMTDENSPLIKALPPATDYLTYLTVVEYNLTTENLPLLHQILQDEKITTNIGWDLVHLLVPHLPHSEQCLQDIARLGNPREVILKVTEGLHLIDYDGMGDDEPEDDNDKDMAQANDDPSVDHVRAKAESSTFPLKTATGQKDHSLTEPSQAVELPQLPPLPVIQFTALISMLSILQPRIKTKYPSRFLCTTLQSILASFSNASSRRDEMVVAILRSVRLIAGIKRPGLPSRKSSGANISHAPAAALSAPDPEGSEHPETRKEESAIQNKLLQAFVTHVLEEYLINLAPYDGIPGMAWCTRMMEKLNPNRNIPGVKLLSARFQADEKLHHRIDAVGPLVALSKDLGISDEDLLSAATSVEKLNPLDNDPDELPNSADEIPLSRLGSLVLLSARKFSEVLHEGIAPSNCTVEIFPEHHKILQNCLTSPDMGTGLLGTEPEALIDAILALGIHCIESDQVGQPASDEQFNEYLQVTALLSANCPNPNLRGHAQYITSTILRSHPDDRVRLAFIRDTLEHCPFENLKVSAVGWIKGETIEANPPSLPQLHDHAHSHSTQEASERSVFATALPLTSLAPFLFPSLAEDLLTVPVPEAWITFQTNLSFYFASLNFLYLLLSAKHLHHALDIRDLWVNGDIAGSFLQPLRDAKSRFLTELADGGVLSTESNEAIKAEFSLLDETIERVTRSAASLNDNAS